MKQGMFEVWNDTMKQTGATVGKFVVMGIKLREHFLTEQKQQIQTEVAELKEKASAGQISLQSKKQELEKQQERCTEFDRANKRLQQKISQEQAKLARARQEIDQKQELI